MPGLSFERHIEPPFKLLNAQAIRNLLGKT
jgi:hypothetical protein